MVCYLLGNTWRVRDYSDYQARVVRTLVIFHGLVPRSCSTLPLFPSRLATALLELDLQFELQSLLDPYYLVVLLLRRTLALLDGAISGLIVLLEVSPSILAGRWPYSMALYRDLSYFS